LTLEQEKLSNSEVRISEDNNKEINIDKNEKDCLLNILFLYIFVLTTFLINIKVLLLPLMS